MQGKLQLKYSSTSFQKKNQVQRSKYVNPMKAKQKRKSFLENAAYNSKWMYPIFNTAR